MLHALLVEDTAVIGMSPCICSQMDRVTAKSEEDAFPI